MEAKFTSRVIILVFISVFAFLKNSFADLSYVPDRLSLGVELANPNGDFGKAQSVGYGGTLRYESTLGDNVALNFTAGYIHFAGQKINTGGVVTKNPSTYMIPGQVGVRYYFQLKQQGIYLMGNIGTHAYEGSEADSTGIHHKLKFAFSYAPEAGFEYQFLDIGIRYQAVAVKDINNKNSWTSYISLRISFVFGSTYSSIYSM